MTTPTQKPVADKQLAKDVATELQRRKRRTRLIIIALWIVIIVLAALYLRCGRGWGLGGPGKGKGEGAGSGSAVKVDPATQRCTVRVTKDGILVDGVKKTRDEAVEACKKTGGGALVTVTGDARQGDWEELKAALEATRVKIFMRGVESDGDCVDNPLAKGCK
jgi:hypothetical protein